MRIFDRIHAFLSQFSGKSIAAGWKAAALVAVVSLGMLVYEAPAVQTVDTPRVESQSGSAVSNGAAESSSEAASSMPQSTLSGTNTSTTGSGPSSTSQNNSSSSLHQSLAEKTAGISNTYKTSGLSLVAFRGEEVLFSYYDGFADYKKTQPVNAATKFRIASVSKTITGLLALQLAGEGRLDLDRDISEYMGIRVRNPRYPDEVITTRMLMTHSSGIVGGSVYTKNTGEPPFDDFETVMNSSGFFGSGRPGGYFRYSNVGAAMIGGVIEGATGKRFSDYATERFQALGIDAGYLRDKILTPGTIAQDFGRYMQADVPNWGRVTEAYDNIPLGQMYLLGHGDLIISAEDLAKLAMVMAGDGTYRGQTVLPPAQLKDMLTAHRRADTLDDHTGLNVLITDHLVEGRTIYGHSGHANGMVAGLYFDPTDHTGMVFLTNGCSSATYESNGKYKITTDLLELLYEELFV